MPSKICPQCNTEYDLNQSFCPNDGAALRSKKTDGDLTGTVFTGRYKLLRKLGGGGMGTVYLAEHVRLKSLLAVKVMKPGFTEDPEAAARFNREAQNASLINHPNVGTVFDFGEEDGQMFLAMEYIDGEPLSELIKRGPVHTETARHIVTQIGEALTAAHRIGIVHRDLKPDNIMVTTGTDGRELVKLVDFGISKDPTSVDQKVTATGAIIGTPAYMSPEQATSDKAVDLRSDIYSFGVLTFQMLTASLPFDGKTASEQLVSRLVNKPSTLTKARPDISWAPAIEKTLATAMANDPSQRYASAQEFARQFDNAVRSTAVRQSGTVMLDAAKVAAEAASSPAVAPAGVPNTMPPTMVSSKKSKTPMFAGAGILAAAAIAGVIFMKSGSVAKPTPTTDSADSVTKDTSAQAPQVKQAASQSPAPLQSKSAATTGNKTTVPGPTEKFSAPITTPPAQKPAANATSNVPATGNAGATSKPADTTHAPAPTPTAAAPAAAAPDISADIQKLKEMVATPDKDDAEYKTAVDRSVSLFKLARTPSDSIFILYYRAKAQVFLEQTQPACRSLSQAADIAKGSPLASTISSTSQRIGCP